MREAHPHPASFDLEALSVGEPAVPDPRMMEHVEGCEVCRTRLRELEAERAALAVALPVAAFMARLDSRVRSRAPLWRRLCASPWRWAAIGATATAALCLAVSAVVTSGDVRSGGDGWRLMGDTAVQAFVKQGEVVSVASGRTTVGAGDSLQFRVTVSQPSYVAVFFMNEKGELTWLVPGREAGGAMPVSAGETLLQATAEFDGATVTERAFVIVRAAPFAPRAVAAELARAFAASAPRDVGASAWLPVIAGLWSAVFDGRAAP